MAAEEPPNAPLVVLGAGYAGASVAYEVDRRGRKRIPVVLVDRHPVHVLRTELYEIGKMARRPAAKSWTVPLERVIEGSDTQFHKGEVQGIDLEAHRVLVDGESLPYGSLAICLGSVATFFGVPGAAEHTHQVYRLTGALKLAETLRRELAARPPRDGASPLRVVVVGGGSTGTEVAAEIATTGWSRVIGHAVVRPQLTLIVGSLPFLAGLPVGLVLRARQLLERAHVVLDEGHNAKEVRADRVLLDNGVEVPFDICIWCAGLMAPPVVANLPVPHGRGGRLKVTDHLEVPNHSGVFGVGDVIEYEDRRTHLLVPGTAQAAIAEAVVVGRNVVARYVGKPLEPFVYREKASLVSVGVGRAAGSLRSVTLWGRPAALLKAFVEKEYALERRHGHNPPGL